MENKLSNDLSPEEKLAEQEKELADLKEKFTATEALYVEQEAVLQEELAASQTIQEKEVTLQALKEFQAKIPKFQEYHAAIQKSQDKIQAFREEQAASKRDTERTDALFRSIRKLFTTVLPLVINLGVIITAIGVLVINFRLAAITTYATYNISLTQYIAAGLVFIGQMAVDNLPGIIGGYLVGSVIGFVLLRVSRLHKFIDWFLRLSFPLFVSGIFVIVLSIVFRLGSFGPTYSQIPRSIGGGAASDIQLVFRENSKDLDWGISIDSKTGRSEKVELILELVDGILVRDNKKQIVVKISNDAIYGIIADSIPEKPAATGTPSAVATQIASPTATP